MKSRMRYKRRPPIFIFAIISILIIVILSGLLIWFVLIREYLRWSKDFESNLHSENVVTLSDNSLKQSLDKKIKNFALSTKKTDYIELKDTEFVYLLSESLDQSLPHGFKLKSSYVESDANQWNIYIQTSLGAFKLPWVKFVLFKDASEGTQIYVSRMSIGNFDFTDYGAKFVIDRINKGINDSLVLVNESDFTGRILRNIELEKGTITIKGDK